MLTDVLDALAGSGLPASRLELEITESVLLQDTPATHAVLVQLRDIGVSISLDDFGTGYSSLSYLHRFPLQEVQDRSLLPARQRRRGTARSLLDGIARLSSDLGCRSSSRVSKPTSSFSSSSGTGHHRSAGFCSAAHSEAADQGTARGHHAEDSQQVA